MTRVGHKKLDSTFGAPKITYHMWLNVIWAKLNQANAGQRRSRSCARIRHTGLRLALNDAYSLWRSCIFELVIVHLCGSLPFPFPPSWLAVVSIQVGKYLHRVSQCDGAWWWLPLFGLPWIPACPARCSHFAWHHNLLS